MLLTNKTWKAFASSLCAGDSKPDEFNPASMKNFMNYFQDYISVVKNVRPQFHAHNSIKQIPFPNAEARFAYENAVKHFLEEKAKLERKEEKTGNSQAMGILGQLIILQIAAERIKADDICDLGYDAVTNRGKAAVMAFKYKVAIAKGVKRLVRHYGVPRSKISIIWGGGNTKVSKKKKEKLDILDKLAGNQEMMDLLNKSGVDLYDLGLGTTEKPVDLITKEDEDLDLGSQTKEKRQIEIDRFQKGESLYCFFTFQAGGVGLSLHHTDEMTKEKCRRKESGYAFEEDIPLIPTRPREMFGAVTYNPVHAVQVFGRCPRLTSLSDTYQYLVGYKGTIETDILVRCSLKLKCLQQVVLNQREDWDKLIIDQISKWNPNKDLPKSVNNDIIEVESEIEETEEDDE